MIKQLITNQWREITRSSVWGRNLVAHILIGVLYLSLASYFLMIGIFIGKIFSEAAPGKDPVRLLNSGILYYLIIDITLRLIIQKNYGMRMKPYMHLPVGRSVLVNYLLSKSFFSIFNFIPLLIAVPFMIDVLIPAASVLTGIIWLLFLFSFLLIDCYLVVYVKKSSSKTLTAASTVVLILIAAVLGEVFKIFSLSDFSASLFGGVLHYNSLLFVPLALLGAVYYTVFRFISDNMYLDSLEPRKKVKIKSYKIFDLLSVFGETGVYMALELRLLLRNKRSRSTVFYGFFMLLLGLSIYPTYTRDTSKYIRPDGSVEKFVSLYEKGEANDPDLRNVTFKVIPRNLPGKATVFIAGNQKILRDWKPDGVPLIKQSDGSWSRTIPFKKNTDLKYKFTLGSWDHELLSDNGKAQKNFELNVSADTSVIITAGKWKTADLPPFTYGMLVYFGIALTGIFLLTYGQFVLSWESSYFDAVLTKKINFNNYFRAKYLLMVFSAVLFYILCLPYAFFGIKVLEVNTAAFFYNIGINSFVILFIATFNKKRFDLSSSLMSQQGKGAGQYLGGFSSLLLPTAIYVPFALMGNENIVIIIFIVMGIAGLLFRNVLLDLIIKQFYKRKYRMAAGFRQLY